MSIKKIIKQLEKLIELNIPQFEAKFYINRQKVFTFTLDWISHFFHLRTIKNFLTKR